MGSHSAWDAPIPCSYLVLSPPPPVDLSQVEITRAYMAKQADEISLQQADVVLLLGEEDGEWGLHPWAWPR